MKIKLSHYTLASTELEPDIPLAAAEAILKALEKSPEDRFASAGEFAKALGGN